MSRKHGVKILIMLFVCLIIVGIFCIFNRKNSVNSVNEDDINKQLIAAEEVESGSQEDAGDQTMAVEESDMETPEVVEGSEDGVNSLLTETEKDNLQNLALKAAKKSSDLYQSISKDDSQTTALSVEQMQEIVNRIGDMGLTCVSDDNNMVNYEAAERFARAYEMGEDAQFTTFTIYSDGMFIELTFTYRSGQVQIYSVGIVWNKNGIPEIDCVNENNIIELKLTDKGYLIYTYEHTIAHGNLREYFRVKPLSDKCRELTKKYISGLSYVNYNLLVTNWNKSNVEDILMPCMFEDIYRISAGKTLKTEEGMIPAKVYEQIMQTYFPVTIEQIRENCYYHENSNAYEYEMIFPRQFPPFGEVVDYTYNADGTITLFVDAVWPDYNSDCAFENQIVIEPHEDGTFRYLSNHIEKRELHIPVYAFQ